MSHVTTSAISADFDFEPEPGTPVTWHRDIPDWFRKGFADPIGNDGLTVASIKPFGTDPKTGKPNRLALIKKDGNLVFRPPDLGEGGLQISLKYLEPKLPKAA